MGNDFQRDYLKSPREIRRVAQGKCRTEFDPGDGNTGDGVGGSLFCGTSRQSHRIFQCHRAEVRPGRHRRDRNPTAPLDRARRRWPHSPRAGEEVRRSRSLARTSSSPWLGSLAPDCPICPMSINLTPYSVSGIAHSRDCCDKLILAAAERFCPITNLVRFVHVYP
jgi:hypothetical protein